MTEIKCIGCGSILQTENKNAEGYIPQSGLNKEEPICQRCYRLRHYNEVQDLEVDSGDFLTMLNSLYETDSLIVKVIDIFDFEGSVIPSFNRIVGDKKVLAVINKIDLLPRSMNTSRLVERAKKMLKDEGITANDTIAISALKGQNLNALLDKISSMSEGKDVYIVGTTNVGKSTLINKLLEDNTGLKNVITTSNVPGTTLGMIDIPLGDSQTMYDTPGIVVDSQISHFVKSDDLKYVSPGKEIKAKTFQLNEEQTLFIGNLGRIDYLTGGQNSFSVYCNHHLTIHRTKLDNAEDFYLKHYDGLLTPPNIDEPFLSENYDEHLINVDAMSDVLISGLAFISIAKDAKVKVRVPKGVNVSVRPTIFKGVQ
ncbi:MAG TPA: ribosome biogenesis GTPase YqeH [Candidatus Jeotgalicoccus stercoravium]|nr:ribosome biogenesis GTPase YqeH [Candidatus Jeotgalicoccus stercoravium]